MPGLEPLATYPLGAEDETIGIPSGEEALPPETPAEEEARGLTVMGREVYAMLGPLAEPDPLNAYPLFALVHAIAFMFRQGEEAARALDGFDPFSQTYDLARTPTWLLPWVGESVGVSVRPGTRQEMVAQIEEEEGWKRGRLTSIIAAIKTTLTGEKRVHLIERQGEDAWRYLVITRPVETPSPSLTAKIGNAAKPMGIIVTYVQSEVRLIDELTGTIDELAGTVDAL